MQSKYSGYDPSAEARAARIAALEVKFENLEKKVDKGLEKLDVIHDLMMKARGARWALVALATLGGSVAGWAHKFLPPLSR